MTTSIRTSLRWREVLVPCCALALGCSGVVESDELEAPRDAGAERPTYDGSARDATVDRKPDSPADVALNPQDAKSEPLYIPPVDPACFVNHGAQLRWLRRYGDEKTQTGGPIHAGPDGDVILAGWFAGHMDFDGAEVDPVNPNQDTNTWWVRLGTDQKALFARSYKGPTVKAMAMDLAGRSHITGFMCCEHAADIDGTTLPIPGIDTNVFIASHEPTGELRWAKRLDGYHSCPKGNCQVEQQGMALATDSEGNVVLAGFFSGTLVMGAQELTALGGELGSRDAFVAKFDSSGNHLWSRRYGGFGWNDIALEVAVTDAGEVLVAGEYQGLVDFGTGEPYDGGDQDMFLLKLDPQGNLLWLRSLGGDGHDVVRGGGVDGQGNFYLGASIPANGLLRRHVITKIDPLGNVLWEAVQEEASSDGNTLFAVGRSGDSAVTFLADGDEDLDFGGGSLGVPGEVPGIVVKYDANGAYLWSATIGCMPGVDGIDVADDGSVLLAGTMFHPVGIGDTVVQTAGHWDVFAMSLGP